MEEFKPFDKVLVRDNDSESWQIDIYREKDNDLYVCFRYPWKQCIPYEGNEHLYKSNKDLIDLNFGDKVMVKDYNSREWERAIFRHIKSTPDFKYEVILEKNDYSTCYQEIRKGWD